MLQLLYFGGELQCRSGLHCRAGNWFLQGNPLVMQFSLQLEHLLGANWLHVVRDRWMHGISLFMFE
jgi:hypothetical protein